MKHASPSHSPQSGFSVFELVLIGVLLVVVYSIFVPRYTPLAITKNTVYSTAHDLESDLQYTRMLSIGGGTTGDAKKNYYLEFFTSGTATDSWRIYAQGDSANPVKTVTVLNGIQLFSTATAVLFYDSRGTPSLTSGGNIDVFDTANNYRWRVSISRNTGRVNLKELK